MDRRGFRAYPDAMLHRVLTLLTILCLSVAPGIAAAYASSMPMETASMQMAGHAGAAEPCHATGACQKAAALCAWACTAGVAVSPLPMSLATAPLPRMMRTAPEAEAGAGLQPAPTDRPPDSLRV